MPKHLFLLPAVVGFFCGPAVAQMNLAPGVVGLPYNLTLGSSGDQLYRRVVIQSGTLPPGLLFNGSGLGVISGVPTQAGTYNLTLGSCNTFFAGCGPPEQWPSQAVSLLIANPCTTLSSESAFFPFAGGMGSVTVTAPSSCNWGAVTYSGALPQPPFWIHPAYATPMGTQTITYTVDSTTYGRSATFIFGDSLFTVSQRRTSEIFQDVFPTSDVFDAINLMSLDHITGGCSSSPPMYCPADPATRGQMAVFIVRALVGDSFTFQTQPYFDDVPADHQFFRFIQKLKELNITSGCDLTHFCPARSVTRAEAVTLLLRASLGSSFTYPTSPYFDDVPSGYPFFAYIQKAAQLQITHGCDVGFFCPNAPASRADIAVFLMRALKGESIP